jgi:hypothetical protein
MGKLVYGPTVYELDDRVLAHLQVVVGMKLRRGENFFVSWRNPTDRGSGRQSLWFDNGQHISFEYDGSRIPSPSREWVEALAASASTNFGLQLTDESGELLNTPHEQVSPLPQ